MVARALSDPKAKNPYVEEPEAIPSNRLPADSLALFGTPRTEDPEFKLWCSSRHRSLTGIAKCQERAREVDSIIENPHPIELLHSINIPLKADCQTFTESLELFRKPRIEGPESRLWCSSRHRSLTGIAKCQERAKDIFKISPKTPKSKRLRDTKIGLFTRG